MELDAQLLERTKTNSRANVKTMLGTAESQSVAASESGPPLLSKMAEALKPGRRIVHMDSDE